MPFLLGGRGMQAYSQDLRDRVLRAVQRGESPTGIAKRLEVSRVWVYQVAQRHRQTGRNASLPVGGYRRSKVAHLQATIRGWLKAEPDLTLAELCERIAGRGVQIKAAGLWYQLNKWGLSFKKNRARQRARASRRAAGTA